MAAGLTSVFVGVPQSKIAGTAILIAVVAVALSVLFGREPVPLSQKFVIVLVMGLLALPAILLTLFQINCLVTGAGFTNQRWWCSLYAWFVAIMVVFYCIMLVVVGLLSYADNTKVVAQEKFRTMQRFSNRMAEGFFAEAEAAKGGAAPTLAVADASKDIKAPTLADLTLPKIPQIPTAGAGETAAAQPAVPKDKAPVLPAAGMATPPATEPVVQAFETFSTKKEGFGSCGAPYGSTF
jgi:hypothetical protein